MGNLQQFQTHDSEIFTFKTFPQIPCFPEVLTSHELFPNFLEGFKVTSGTPQEILMIVDKALDLENSPNAKSLSIGGEILDQEYWKRTGVAIKEKDLSLMPTVEKVVKVRVYPKEGIYHWAYTPSGKNSPHNRLFFCNGGLQEEFRGTIFLFTSKTQICITDEYGEKILIFGNLPQN
jgi:hypothetical protein